MAHTALMPQYERSPSFTASNGAFNGPAMLLGPDGKPFREVPERRLQEIRRSALKMVRTYMEDMQSRTDALGLGKAQQSLLQGKWDAAQTVTSNNQHWLQADHLDPDSAASYGVRRTLRSRSRYEVNENNPYLKGVVLTIANDFVGSGPKIKFTDKRLSKEKRRELSLSVSQWFKQIKLRQKLWRLRLAKMVDGEAFSNFFLNPRINPFAPSGGTLDLNVIECDRFSTMADGVAPLQENEIDGVRLDNYGQPLEYYLLKRHPGSTAFFFSQKTEGQWIPAEYIIHWFRRDRGWMRGIPETAPSLPLCAILRRYTIAVLRAAETAADFSAVLETESPPGSQQWTDGAGNLLQDDPFDTIPLEAGVMTTLPWGYKLRQFDAKQPVSTYDIFVDAILREIVRPLLVPFNIAAGSSKDSNMASGVLDSHIYKTGVRQERLFCEEEVLDPLISMWWHFNLRNRGYFDDVLNIPAISYEGWTSNKPSLWYEAPEHTYRWDPIGLEHTDPLKVASAIALLHQEGFLTDRDIQELYYNRDIDEWANELEEQQEIRKKLLPETDPNQDGDNSDSKSNSGSKSGNKSGSKKSRSGSKSSSPGNAADDDEE